MASFNCKHCKEEVELEHDADHPGLCCDCFDLSCGMPLEQLNQERALKSKGPLKVEER